MVRTLRALHGYFALALAAFLLLYTASGWMIIHKIGWGTPELSSLEIPLPELAGGLPLDARRAKALASAAAERGGLAAAASGAAKQEDGAWRVSLTRVARSAEVTLRPGAAAARVELRSASLDEGVKRLHRIHAAGARGARLAWAIGIDLLSLALIGFSITGVILFWSLKRDRRLGLALLAASTLYTLGSMAMLLVAR